MLFAPVLMMTFYTSVNSFFANQNVKNYFYSIKKIVSDNQKYSLILRITLHIQQFLCLFKMQLLVFLGGFRRVNLIKIANFHFYSPLTHSSISLHQFVLINLITWSILPLNMVASGKQTRRVIRLLLIHNKFAQNHCSWVGKLLFTAIVKSLVLAVEKMGRKQVIFLATSCIHPVAVAVFLPFYAIKHKIIGKWWWLPQTRQPGMINTNLEFRVTVFKAEST